MKTLHPLRRARYRALLFVLSAAPSLVLTPFAVQATACSSLYTVRPGDSLWRISSECHLSVASLRQLNRVSTVLHIGQKLRVSTSYTALPSTSTTSADSVSSTAVSFANYRVKVGDNLWTIATKWHVSTATLAATNKLHAPYLLRVGRSLHIPVTASTSLTASSYVATPAARSVVQHGLYRVKAGDTVWDIAHALGLSPKRLAADNSVSPAHPIQPGQVLHYTIIRDLYTGPSPAEVLAALRRQAQQVGIDITLLQAIAWQESSWRMVDASDGGIGVMQLMPDTVRWLRGSYVPGAWNPHSMTDNVHAGAVLLRLYSQMYNNNIVKIATAYHGGIGAVSKHPNAEMRSYIHAIVSARNRFTVGG